VSEALNKLRLIVGDAGFITHGRVADALLTDERGLYTGRAAAIVQPQTTVELAEAVRICYDAGIGMVPQGGNTGYCGGATPDGSGTEVLFNLSRMNTVGQVDKHDFTITAQAGVVLSVAQQVAAEHDLLLPLSMGSEGSCQLGGNVSTNAGGLAVLRYGTARELVAGLEVVLPDGRVWRDLKGLRKDNTGYDLKQLFMGAEGTLGIISTVVLRLHPMPRSRVTAWLSIDDIGKAVTLLTSLRSELGDCITSFEYISREAMALVLRHVPGTTNPIATAQGHSVLIELVAYDDGSTLTNQLERALADALETNGINDAVIAQSDRQRLAFWRLRESIPASEKRAGGSVKHDVSVPIGGLHAYANDAVDAMQTAFPNSRLSIYGHVGDGNIHFNVLPPEGEKLDRYRQQNADAISKLIHGLAVDRNGSFSAEHGVGKLKRDVLAEMGDPIGLQLMRQLKTTLDPKGLMNPGKVL